MKKAAMVLIAVVIFAAAGAGGYMLGVKTGENRVLSNPTQLFQQLRAEGGQGSQFGGQGQFMGPSGTPQAVQRGTQGEGGGMTGTVESIDGSTVVVSMADGTMVRVQTTDTTLIQKYMTATVQDLQKGERIMFSGSKNDDGSYTARSIESLRSFPGAPTGQ
jgi:hypothetical protein